MLRIFSLPRKNCRLFGTAGNSTHVVSYDRAGIFIAAREVRAEAENIFE